MSNSLKTAGHLYKKQLENWLSKPSIFNDTTNKKDCDNFIVTVFCLSVIKKIPCFESGKSTMQRNFIVFFRGRVTVASIPDTLLL